MRCTHVLRSVYTYRFRPCLRQSHHQIYIDRQNGSNLSIKSSVAIGTMINFNGDFDSHGHRDDTSKQAFRFEDQSPNTLQACTYVLDLRCCISFLRSPPSSPGMYFRLSSLAGPTGGSCSSRFFRNLENSDADRAGNAAGVICAGKQKISYDIGNMTSHAGS